MGVLLAGDIGGTKTDLALFSADAGPRAPIVQAEFASRNYPDLQAIIREFVAKHPSPIEHACFDVDPLHPTIGSSADDDA